MKAPNETAHDRSAWPWGRWTAPPQDAPVEHDRQVKLPPRLCPAGRALRLLSSIFEYLTLHFDNLPRTEATRVQLNTQVRVQQMLAFIHAHYAEAVTLADIAGTASISRSEAGRCFQAYMGCSPVDALIRHRLQKAHGMLQDTTRTLQEISQDCGLNSVNYFSRQFRKHYGYAPSRANERLK